MKPSVLTKSQKIIYGPKIYTDERGMMHKLTVTVRHDDECGNGHNSFAITGEEYLKTKYGQWKLYAGGCMHKTIAEHFPTLAPYIKYHLMSTDGPMHYLANTLYHVKEHGPTHAWVYYTVQDPLKLIEQEEILLTYPTSDKAQEAEGKPGYRVVYDEKTSKKRNLDYARSSAVWPEATDEELLSPDLEIRLKARLPKLMEEFQQAVESLGLVY